MFRASQELVNASKANLATSLSLATRSIEDAADLVRRQLTVAMAMMDARRRTPVSAGGDSAVPARELAKRDEDRERQLQTILDLSCQSLEVTTKAQTELVRLIQDNWDNFQHMSRAMMIHPDPTAGEAATPRAFRRA